MLLRNWIKSSCYHDIWKKNLISSLFIKKWQTIGWKLPTNFSFTFGKIFEKIIFNRIYNFLLRDLWNPNLSGFRPSDPCINQLLAITHEIFDAFDCNPPLEVMLVFLDISKVFDKICHKGLLYKLKSMGISGDFFNLLENHLSGRLQSSFERTNFIVETSFSRCPSRFHPGFTSFSS